VFRREVNACAAEAGTLIANDRPGEALAQWLKRYSRFLSTKKGLVGGLALTVLALPVEGPRLSQRS
jgi:hypothetical protein